MRRTRNELAIIIVSANSASWLRPCLTTVLDRAGDIALDAVVVAAGCADHTVSLVEREFPWARVLSCDNRGFAYANNQALRTVDADWILFLNPDTEILEGTLAGLVERAVTNPSLGLVGVRQVTADGELFPTIRRFPTPTRSLFEALGSERYPFRASWFGERELDLRVYERDVPCDWTTGAFMLVRREALESSGFFDERFFLYCEETDLCFRIRQAGWEIRHLPDLTILHHANKDVANPRLQAQAAFARRQYNAKHFTPTRRLAANGALALGLGIRVLAPDRGSGRRKAARAALGAFLGLKPPPFGPSPRVAVGGSTAAPGES